MRQMFVGVQPSALFQDVKWHFVPFTDTIWLLCFAGCPEQLPERVFPKAILLKVHHTKWTAVVNVLRGLWVYLLGNSAQNSFCTHDKIGCCEESRHLHGALATWNRNNIGVGMIRVSKNKYVQIGKRKYGFMQTTHGGIFASDSIS